MQQRAGLHTRVLNALEEQIAVLDATGTIIEVNDAWRRFGLDNGACSVDGCMGANYLEVLETAADEDEHARVVRDGLRAVMAGDQRLFTCEYPCHSPDEQRWFLMRATVAGGDGEPLFVVSHHDITERRLAEEEAREMALQDPLTGLANRRAFDLFIQREVRRSRRDQVPVSLITVDVDHFKAYNDEFGHPAGDEYLARLGRILLEVSARPGDLAVRLGGDEFVVVLGETDQAGAYRMAQAILERVHATEPVPGTSRALEVSLGVASTVYHASLDPDVLIREADEALYQAKSAGRNRIGWKGADAPDEAEPVMPRAG